jgi:V8-like Glu-specific endopeptidase
MLRLVIYLSFLALCAPALAQRPLIEGDMTKVDVRLSIGGGEPLSSGSVFRRELIDGSRFDTIRGSSFLRVRFSDIIDRSRTDYSVDLLGHTGRQVYSYTKDKFALHSNIWSPVIEGDYIQVVVRGDTPPVGLSFAISDVAFAHREIVKYSIVHVPSELEKIENYADVPAIFAASRPVAKLVFFDSGHLLACSGFLIDDDRLLTNQHCIDSDDTCKGGASATFGYEEDKSGKINSGKQYACAELIDSDSNLDFALVRLEDEPGIKWGHLPLTRRLPTQDEQAFLIQHPGGDPKQIARKDCYVSTLAADWHKPATDLGHKCDTARGSSGSPLIGKDYQVVGLHHLGFDDDGRWKAENRAVHIGQIMDRLNLR